MSRYFLIHRVDGTESTYADSDLPLSIGSGDDAHIPTAGSKDIEAYIGESQGHLFLQPATAAASAIFLNDEIVDASVWIKSGDVIRIGGHIITYTVSGDRVIIALQEQETIGEEQSLSPPTISPKAKPLPRIRESGHEKKPWWKRRHLWPALAGFCVLVLAALFVLVAKPMEITVTPEPDVTAVYGFPPAIKVGDRYLALKNTYVYTAEKSGYEKLVEELDLSEAENGNRFAFTLKKLPGKIKIASHPPEGVTVYIDNKHIGVSPLPEIELGAGDRLIRLEKDLYRTVEQTISVAGMRKNQMFTFSLQPDWADIHLTSTQPSVTVRAGDTVLGSTPCTVQLSSGSHTLTFSKDTFSDQDLVFDVVAGEPITSHIELQPAPALVTITSVPTNALVVIDGGFQGHTPLTAELTSIDKHTVTLSAPGYSSKEARLVLRPDEKKDLTMSLSLSFGTIFLSVEPANAQVFINGKQQGLTSGRFELPTREQVIEVRAKGYKTEKRTIVPQKGYSQQVAIRLKTSAASAGASAPKFNVTAIGNELVLVKPSAFVMGAPRREPGRRSNEGEREVVLTRPFYLSRKPVTNKEFRRFRKDHNSGAVQEHPLHGNNQPVVNLSWEDAVQFLNWLSRQEGLSPFYRQSGDTFVPVDHAANGYRLPTEAEWAYAARVAGRKDRDRYPWQGSFPPREVSGNFADESARALLPSIISGYNDGFPATSPVGHFPPNKAGFYDMGGNVSEWCHDYYTAYTGGAKKAVNPMGPDSGTHRVIRGSSWRDSTIMELRLSYRGYHRKSQDYVGFRIARYP